MRSVLICIGRRHGTRCRGVGVRASGQQDGGRKREKGVDGFHDGVLEGMGEPPQAATKGMPDRRWDAIWVTQTARALFAMGCEAVYKVKRWGRAAMGEAMCGGLVACTRS